MHAYIHIVVCTYTSLYIYIYAHATYVFLHISISTYTHPRTCYVRYRCRGPEQSPVCCAGESSMGEKRWGGYGKKGGLSLVRGLREAVELSFSR